MPRSPRGILLPDLLGDDDGTLLRQRLYGRLRQAILERRLQPGARLASTRALARELGLSRHTVEDAFAQLDGEGFLVRRIGDGTYVAHLPAAPAPAGRGAERRGRRRVSTRWPLLALSPACDEPLRIRPFRAGVPALDAFPLAAWRRILARRARRPGASWLGYGDPAGFAPLREAVAEHVAAARNVRCDPSRVVILTSAQQALDLAARLLLDPGDEVWMEDPGYPGARAAFAAAGAKVCPIPVDDHGLDVEAGERCAPRARLAYVTPSHQYPTGAVLSLPRRLALLAWADRADAWVIEDDYDGEFRFGGRPLSAVQGIDPGERVVHVGTFTKTMFPSLRVAYAILPPDLAEGFARARAHVDGHTPVLTQAALADFLFAGQFDEHLRRMRGLYQERRDTLLGALARDLGGELAPGPSEAGLQVAAWLREGTEDAAVSARAARLGVEVPRLSPLYLSGRGRQGLLLGYAGLTPAEIAKGVAALSRALYR